MVHLSAPNTRTDVQGAIHTCIWRHIIMHAVVPAANRTYRSFYDSSSMRTSKEAHLLGGGSRGAEGVK